MVCGTTRSPTTRDGADDREPLAQALLRGSRRGPRRSPAVWPAADLFPLALVVEIKALACERPADLGLPLSRLSHAEIARVAVARDIVEAISVTTVWRWLGEDALKPWRYRSWIFPRDPAFERKAGLVLDLYRGRWQGEPLRPDEHVVCADEKTSIQARARIHPGSPPAPRRAVRVEHEYERRGALAYLAAWDVHRAQVFGRCEPRTGIAPFGRLVDQVMSEEPYRQCPTGLLGRRQRQLASRPPDRGPAARTVAADPGRPHAGPRVLAEPGRDLLQHRAAQGS